MVFTYGSKEHIYIQMSPDTQKAMKKVLKHVAAEGVDINSLVGVAMQELAKAIEVKSKKKPKPKEQDATPF